MITPQLLADAIGCSPERAATFAYPLAEAQRLFEINTEPRLSMFLAQVGHESGRLRWVHELWGPTPAQERYEGRADLGNVNEGDGERYLGRGLIQITGRANYRATSRQLAALIGDDVPDFEQTPEALELPRWAALSAGNYWMRRGCNRLADEGDFVGVTKRINGGLNGYQERVALWDQAKKVFVA